MVDHTVLFCCQCGAKTMVPLSNRFNPHDFFKEDDPDAPIEITSKYYEFSELLNLIDEMKFEIEKKKKENEMYKNLINSNKEKKKLHDWMIHRMTYVEEVIKELRKMEECNEGE